MLTNRKFATSYTIINDYLKKTSIVKKNYSQEYKKLHSLYAIQYRDHVEGPGPCKKEVDNISIVDNQTYQTAIRHLF